MNIEIKNISAKRFSSNYGDKNNAYGQPLGYKSIVIVSVEEKGGLKRYSELYAGIYIPEVIPNIVDLVAKNYIGMSFNRDNIFKLINIPFVTNSGVFKSVIGAIQSCIIQLYFHKNDISLVDGLASELIKSGDDKLFYYASGGSVAFNCDECKADVSKISANKFDGFKMRCGLHSIDKDILRVKTVREEINSKSSSKNRPKLMIDFIQGTLKKKFSAKDLNTYVNSLKEFDIFWFEEPLDPDKYFLYSEFNSTYDLNINLAIGESFTSINEYLLYQNFINYYQLDITHCGGFSEAINIINYFSNLGSLKFTSHVWGSALSGLLNLSLARASSKISWFEIPLLDFEINKHLFQNSNIDYQKVSNSEIDKLLSEVNLSSNQKYKFIYGSGYKI